MLVEHSIRGIDPRKTLRAHMWWLDMRKRAMLHEVQLQEEMHRKSTQMNSWAVVQCVIKTSDRRKTDMSCTYLTFSLHIRACRPRESQ